MTAYDLPQIVSLVGTFDIRIYSSDSTLTAPTVDTILMNGDKPLEKTETIDQSLGVSSFSTISLQIRDDYSDGSHPEGFWYAALSASQGYVRILLDSNPYFVGTVQLAASRFNELSLFNGTYIRIGSLTLLDIGATIFETPTLDWIVEVSNHLTDMTTGFAGVGDKYPTDGCKLNVLLASLLYAGARGVNSAYSTSDISYVFDASNPDFKFFDATPNTYTIDDLFIAYRYYDATVLGACDYFNYDSLLTTLAGTISTNGLNVTGVGTSFTTEAPVGTVLVLGDVLTGNTAVRHVMTVADNTHLTIDLPMSVELAGHAYASYSSSGSPDQYWPNISENASGILAILFRNMGFALRMDYDSSTETSSALGTHKIQLVQKTRAYSGTLNFSDREKVSEIAKANEMIAQSVRVQRKFTLVGFSKNDIAYDTLRDGRSDLFPALSSYDIDLEVLFDVLASPILPTSPIAGSLMCRVFFAYDGANYVQVVDCSYYNFDTAAYVLMSSLSASDLLYVWALCAWYFYRFTTSFSRFSRIYGHMTADAGAGETFTCLSIGRRTSIDDGTGAANFFANRVTLKPVSSEVEIEWVKES